MLPFLLLSKRHRGNCCHLTVVEPFWHGVLRQPGCSSCRTTTAAGSIPTFFVVFFLARALPGLLRCAFFHTDLMAAHPNAAILMVPHGSRVLVGLGLVLFGKAVCRTFVAFGASFCRRRVGENGSAAPGQWLRPFSASCPLDNAAADAMKRQRETANQAAHLFERQIMIPVLSAVVFVVAERDSDPLLLSLLSWRCGSSCSRRCSTIPADRSKKRLHKRSIQPSNRSLHSRSLGRTEEEGKQAHVMVEVIHFTPDRRVARP